MSSFKKYNIDPTLYLEIAKARAKKAGYDPNKLILSKNKKHKLTYDGVHFGLHPYPDFIIYSILAKDPDAPEKYTTEYARQKRTAYLKRSGLIKGDWKQDPNSPNNLARNINW